MKPSTQRSSAPHKTALLLTVLPLLLTACSATSPACPSASQPLPAPPSMRMPQPQESYSARAQLNISGWQNKLMDTQLMRD